jgi:hypothetical protein
MHTTDTSSSTDFALERYKADREQELELKRATDAYEHAWIKAATTLNGGAAAAFVTLLGIVWKTGEHPWPMAVSALLCWAVGLLLTSAATNRALQAQIRYADGVRLWRETEEFRRFNDDEERRLPYEKERKEADQRKPSRRWFDLSRRTVQLRECSLEDWFIEQARAQFEWGNRYTYYSVRCTWLSTVAFSIGLGFAALAVLSPP